MLMVVWVATVTAMLAVIVIGSVVTVTVYNRNTIISNNNWEREGGERLAE